MDLVRAYDLDLVKLTPCGLYAIEDYARDCIVCPGTEHDAPYLQRTAVSSAENWLGLRVLKPDEGALGRELKTLARVASALKGEIPVLMTVYSPITLAFKLAGPETLRHLRESPEKLHTGLATLMGTTIRFGLAALAAGADGLFLATQLASRRWLTVSEYMAFGTTYDLGILAETAKRAAMTVLHLHGTEVYFDLAEEYPVDAVSWHDKETAPSLRDARRRTNKAFVTGLDRDLVNRGPPSVIKRRVREAIAAVHGRGLILAPCCVLPTTTPHLHLQAVRDAVVSS